MTKEDGYVARGGCFPRFFLQNLSRGQLLVESFFTCSYGSPLPLLRLTLSFGRCSGPNRTFCTEYKRKTPICAYPRKHVHCYKSVGHILIHCRVAAYIWNRLLMTTMVSWALLDSLAILLSTGMAFVLPRMLKKFGKWQFMVCLGYFG